MASNDTSSSEETLSQLFDRGMDLHAKILDSPDPAPSPAFQSRVKKAVLILEDATRLVSILDVFSKNETIAEVNAEHIKFFLLPGLLGDLQSRLIEDGVDREENMDLAEIYYRDFLTRCNDYGVCKARIPEKREPGADGAMPGAPPFRPGVAPTPEEMSRMNRERDNKIARFKAKKEMEARLKELKVVLKLPNTDEDLIREYYLKTVQLFVGRALDEMTSFEQERPMLAHMKQVLAGRAPDPKAVRDGAPKPRPLQPIIITKDKIQKEIFGLGYKNIPILSIEEFYDQRVREGWFPDPSKTKGKSLMGETQLDQKDQMEEEDRVKEDKRDRDDPEELERLRNWDEYKDDHKRGEGNRHNKG